MSELRAEMRNVRDAAKAAIRDAIDAGSYSDFLAAVGEDGPLAEAITSEGDFAQLVAAHEAREAGDRETAAAIMAELGIERDHGKGEGGRHGGERGFSGPDEV